MDNKIIELLSEEIRETKKLVIETRRMADAAEKKADAAMMVAEESKKQTEQLRELVIITRSEWQDFRDYLRLPWWKKLLGSKEA